MLLEQVGKMTARERLWYWIRERHAVYVKRAAGLGKPWTTDPIIQSTYFTNPYRENDKVTRWVKNRIRDPLRLNPHASMLFAVLAFRWFNWIPTGEVLLGMPTGHKMGALGLWDTDKVCHKLTGLAQLQQVFTGAFTISNGGSTKPKVQWVCEDYIAPVWYSKACLAAKLCGSSLATAHAHLMCLPGMGGTGFMAAQVIADLKHTDVLKDATDWWSWCSQGPGSRRGMNILHDRSLDTRIGLSQWQDEIYHLQMATNEMLVKCGMVQVCAQDLQNCLCEFSKYERVRTGGRAKRQYRGVL